MTLYGMCKKLHTKERSEIHLFYWTLSMKMRFVVLFFVACSSDSKIATDEGEVSNSVEIDADGDGFTGAEDCDDSNPEAYIGAEEICDGVDNNCDGEIDEELLVEFYLDADGDGYGTQDETILECSALDGYAEYSGDCDDDNDLIHPQAPEQCDEIDNDCDGEIDEEVVTTWYADVDQDGFGDPEAVEEYCIQPEGYVENGEDCDDEDDLIHPDASEQCDEIDIFMLGTSLSSNGGIFSKSRIVDYT